MGHRECSWGASSTCAGKGCAACCSPHHIPQAGKCAPDPPEAGTYLLCLPSLWNLPSLLGGGVLMRPCMPRMPLEREDTTADGGNDEAGGWDFVFASLAPVWDSQLASWSAGSSLSWSLQSAHAVISQRTRARSQQRKCQNNPPGRTKQTMPNVLALNVWHLIGVGAGHWHSELQMYWVPAPPSFSWSICRFVRSEDITIDLSSEHWWNCCWNVCSGEASGTLLSEQNQWGWSSEKGKLNIFQDVDRRIARANVKWVIPCI